MQQIGIKMKSNVIKCNEMQFILKKETKSHKMNLTNKMK